ncbi:DUF4136 domain-containing protein [Pontibacter sp. G13]|uniref:DUF4136 domain-containing protein n=1 Tax=Pontibacter sp. G13 TaxID=3074898 RepID=UPI00288B8800|nr:DUF4136 domain-containing protein [Pontibacter sp. G13]WNJ19192.1 DUF4136 domain-containing protein [Pontibacter sp. G13]
MKSLLNTSLSLMIFCLAVVFMTSCTGYTVSTDIDKQADFTQFRTYKFRSIDSNVKNGAFTDISQRRILDAIRSEMNSRGYKEVESGEDLDIVVFVAVQNKTEVSTTPYPTPGYYYGPFWYNGWYTYDTNVYNYQEGTLFIDLVDSGKQQLVWQGTATKAIDKKDRSEEKIDKIVGAIYSKYPHTAGN